MRFFNKFCAFIFFIIIGNINLCFFLFHTNFTKILLKFQPSNIVANEFYNEVLKTKFNEELIKNRKIKNVVFLRANDSGYGNRIYAMISAFLIAIISDSILLLEWPSVENFIDYPHNGLLKLNKNSYMDLYRNSTNICTINTITPNTWSYNKKLNIIQGRDKFLSHASTSNAHGPLFLSHI